MEIIDQLFEAGLPELALEEFDCYYAYVLKAPDKSAIRSGLRMKDYVALLGPNAALEDQQLPAIEFHLHAALLALEDDVVPDAAVEDVVPDDADDNGVGEGDSENSDVVCYAMSEPKRRVRRRVAVPGDGGLVHVAIPPVVEDGPVVPDGAGAASSEEDVVIQLMPRPRREMEADPDLTTWDNINGFAVREELSNHGYHRIHIKCPLSAIEGSEHLGCATSRCLGVRQTRRHGRIEAWGFLGAWSEAAHSKLNRNSHQRYRPNAADTDAFLRSKGKIP